MNAKDNNENESVTPSILLKNLYSSVDSVLEKKIIELNLSYFKMSII